jgi:hypothetical protein
MGGWVEGLGVVSLCVWFGWVVERERGGVMWFGLYRACPKECRC